MQQSNELVKVVETSGLESQTATMLQEKFYPFFQQAEQWKKKAETLVVTNISQVDDMKQAREMRLALKQIRVNADKTRKELKEDSLRYGKAVQGVYNVIEYLIVPIEEHLEKQEKFPEIQEAKRRNELKEQRELELKPYYEFVPYGLDLGVMSESDYEKLLNGVILQYNAKIESERLAEQQRLENEKKQAEERERIKLENERLKLEAQERERHIAEQKAKAEAERKAIEEKARKEREIVEAKLRAERDEKLRIEAQLKAERDEQERQRIESEQRILAELKAKKLAEKRAKAAPDKAKLIEFANALENMDLPKMKSEDGEQIINDVAILLKKITNFIREKTSNI